MDWVDINMGCPLTQLHNKSAGCMLMRREKNLHAIVEGMTNVLKDTPLTLKSRKCLLNKDEPFFHLLAPKLLDWGASGLILHGRSAQQRYTKLNDWDYITSCAEILKDKCLFVGNGDLFDPEGICKLWKSSKVDSVMIGRGALLKPWIFEEIKRGSLWDISSGERFEMLKRFCNYGLYHWGSDRKGVETTRRFLLEHLSFLCRYIPVGLLEQVPQKLNMRPPLFVGRNELETLMAGANTTSWIKISQMLLGKVPEDFKFIPKHKSSGYDEVS